LSYGHHDLMHRQYSGGIRNCQAFFGRSSSHAVELAEDAREKAADALKQAKEATRHAQVLAEKLRSLGINPDDL